MQKKYNYRDKLSDKNTMALYSPNEAIMVGTIFKTLDIPYKDYRMTPFLNENEKEKLMFEIQKFGLFNHDLSLYLDVYPNDENALKVREEYLDKYETLLAEYNMKYSPISLSADKSNSLPFPWSTSVFPWGDE